MRDPVTKAWLGLGLGDADPEIAKFKEFAKSKFKSYAGSLDDNGVYTRELAAVVSEMQARYGLPVTGILDYASKVRSGFLKVEPPAKPYLYTVHGTGVADPFGFGLPADTARAVLDIYTWQPVGWYPAAAFPMWPSITAGVSELVSLIAARPGKFALAGYSQGACVVSTVLKHFIMNPNGALHHRLGDVTKVVCWGNPMRQKGFAAFDEWIWPIAKPDTGGIMAWDRLEGLDAAPFQMRDYAHAGDMYASNNDSDKDEYKRAICKIVMKATDIFEGPDSLVSQLKELSVRPVQEGLAMASAIIDAGKFFTGTAHGYNIGPAIEFLRAA